MANDTNDRVVRLEEALKNTDSKIEDLRLSVRETKVDLQARIDQNHQEVNSTLKEILTSQRSLPERLTIIEREQTIINGKHIEMRIELEKNTKWREQSETIVMFAKWIIGALGVSNVVIIFKFVLDLLQAK